MNYNFLPRFYYSLTFTAYLSSFFKTGFRAYLPDLFSPENLFFCNYGRTGLRLLLNSISKNALTIGVQLFTCNTVFQAIRKAGHNIKFLDVDENLRLDLEDLRKKINDIDVLIITHIFGYPENIDAIKKISGNRIIIEDCAHAFLSRTANGYCGTLGDASFFSTGLGKLPPIGQGGFVRINAMEKFPDFKSEYSKLRNESMIRELIHLIRVLLYSLLLRPPLYGPVAFGFGKKLDARLDFMKKEDFTESRGFRSDRRFFLKNGALFLKLVDTNRQNHQAFDPGSNDSIRTINPLPDSSPNYYVCPLLAKDREKIIGILRENGFEAGRHFARSVEWAIHYSYISNDCPGSEKIASHIVTVPIHNGISYKNILKLSSILGSIPEQP